jgi:hypothetical protein
MAHGNATGIVPPYERCHILPWALLRGEVGVMYFETIWTYTVAKLRL